MAELGKADDPLIRQDLMRLYSMDQISGWGVQRAKAGQASTDAKVAKTKSGLAAAEALAVERQWL